ncbi:MAG: GMC family oxidoreductase [Elainella sp. Prado103]|nr:GMC family oxidoreductase [Elainella sp. Prado103]
MLINAREIPQDRLIRTEVCIIGSGPAGMTLAREFAGQNIQVCLLESGNLDNDPQAQALSEAQTIGDPFLSPQITRNRQVGGNSNVWAIKTGNGQIGVRYAPLDAIDFEKRDWLPYSGWPFAKTELDPFYERAQQVCQSGFYDYEAEFWESEEAQRLPLDPDRLITTMFQFGPKAVFHDRYRDQLIQSDNIHVYINATVLEIEANTPARTATRVRVASTPGQEFWLEATVFVLAQGGMESARLLLLSDRQQANGLGNQHDLVGRFFMDHPLVDGGVFVPADPGLYDQMALYDLRQVKQHPVLGKLNPAPQLMRQQHLLNTAIVLFPRPSRRQWDAILAFKALLEPLAKKQLPPQALQLLPKILKGLDYVTLASYLAATKKQSLLHGFGRGGWSELSQNQHRFKGFEVLFQTEQAPDPSNRLELSTDRDRFGCRKLQLHWKWGAIDSDSVARMQDILAAELAAQGLGTYQISRPNGRPKLCSPSGVAHHMGTTRMHDHPTQGVVDANCRVHGLSNLFIASSSVFPTGGYANPTLTIVALALRLADHLKQVLRQPPLELTSPEIPTVLES